MAKRSVANIVIKIKVRTESVNVFFIFFLFIVYAEPALPAGRLVLASLNYLRDPEINSG